MNRYTNYLFYALKPLIPRSLQIALRRKTASYKRKRYSSAWPIDLNAGIPPVNWTGWPEGKQFAFVLSHDVDTLKGYDNVLKLAEIEKRLGFRSCFSFVPERYGKISIELLKELRMRGFDVAVHGLKHDGKLFLSKRTFERRAKRINDYLEKWNTKGFTSPSMHHNLEWLSSLNINYSISTFDTDPFEPQPDGVGTIFPLWVSNGEPDHGFVEMPYTLPQDSTLFIILKEKTIDTWEKKLDWVARHGGMALLITHPDYMDFGNGKPCNMRYPVGFYMKFLKYVRTRYSDDYYHDLPANVGAFFQEWIASSKFQGK